MNRELDCNEIVELVTDYLEGSLDPETRARVDLHLIDCDGCTNYVEQFRATVRTVAKIDDIIDPAFRLKLLGAFRDFR